MVFREDETFKARFNQTVEMLLKETNGKYSVGSDLTPAQQHARFKRLQKLVIHQEIAKK